MSIERCAITCISALVLFGCEQSSPPTAQTPSTPVVLEPTIVPGQPDGFTDIDDSPLTRAEVIGMWGLRAGCGQPYVFSEDGTFADYAGASGNWSIENDVLTLTYANRISAQPVNQLNDNTFAAGDPNGLMVMYQRC